MSYRPLEECAQDPDTPNSVTPPKPPLNAEACHYNDDAENWNVSAKLLSFVILASIDGFVGRIDNEHFTTFSWPRCMNRVHDCAEYYHSELNTSGLLIFYRNRVRYAPGSQFVSLHALQ